MRRENLPWFTLALLLLAGGWFASQQMQVSLPAGQATAETFREWLWGIRSLDLAVQVGIIFVGALGIAALLPRGDDMAAGRTRSHDEAIVDRPDRPGKREAR